ncbi:MAG: glycosyltransferase family 39 protein [bacterium]|nr:glycosyltransferase family 39 protein [bacterium]
MQKVQILSFIKNPKFILALILVIFFLKGAFLTTLSPIFTGQDEARHYSSLQYRAEPKDKNWEKIDRPVGSMKSINIADYNFSHEMIHAGEAADYNVFRHQMYNTVNFSDGYNGINEAEINHQLWKPYNYFKQPDIVSGKNLYYFLATSLEKILSGSDILVRFFSNRILSTVFGTIGIFLAYLIFKNIGIKEKESLILTAITAFQPKYAMYFASINYDVLLIPLFFLFTLGAVFSLRNGFNWKNGSLMLLAIGLGFFTKATALILILPFFGLVVYFIYSSYKKKINLKIILLAIIIFVIIAYFSNYNFISILPFKNNVSETFHSFGSYLSESLTLGRFALSSRTYWGSLGWFSNAIDQNFTNFVWTIQTISVVGIIFLLFSKKKLDFLPEKKYVVFMIGMIFALQLGIRMADWKVFMGAGELELGTPGRYFLPNLVSHIALVFIGLGALLRKENYFRNALLAGLIVMISFSMYLIFNIILPRYYL